MKNPADLETNRQRGAALLVLLLLVLVASGFSFVSTLNKSGMQDQRRQITLAALSQARQALIAWSVVQGDVGKDSLNRQRPGSLPCPSADEAGLASLSCATPSGTTLGRLPWKSLGIEALRDADGELLWYAVSANFRIPGLSNAPLNSDAKGQLLLYAADGATLLTPFGEELAALVFAPGAALAGQNRNTAPNASASFLDVGNGRSNRVAIGPFIAGPSNDGQGNPLINDIVLGLSARDLMAASEKRVLAEAQAALTAFAGANGGKYPNPAAPNGANCATAFANIASPTSCAGNSGICFGRFPEDLAGLPIWFLQNGWGRLLTYAVNKNDAKDGSASECSPALNIDGQSRRYVLLAPGAPLSTQTRPSATLSNYLEDAVNNDAWSAAPSGRAAFTLPGPNSNDQIRSLP